MQYSRYIKKSINIINIINKHQGVSERLQVRFNKWVSAVFLMGSICRQF